MSTYLELGVPFSSNKWVNSCHFDFHCICITKTKINFSPKLPDDLGFVAARAGSTIRPVHVELDLYFTLHIIFMFDLMFLPIFSEVLVVHIHFIFSPFWRQVPAYRR